MYRLVARQITAKKAQIDNALREGGGDCARRTEWRAREHPRRKQGLRRAETLGASRNFFTPFKLYTHHSLKRFQNDFGWTSSEELLLSRVENCLRALIVALLPLALRAWLFGFARMQTSPLQLEATRQNWRRSDIGCDSAIYSGRDYRNSKKDYGQSLRDFFQATCAA